MDFIFRIFNRYPLMSNDGKQYSKKVHDFDFTNLATAMKTCSIVSFDTTQTQASLQSRSRPFTCLAGK